MAGLILGPPLLGIVTASEPIELLAEFGIFFLMFYAGLEMVPKEAVEQSKWVVAAVVIKLSDKLINSQTISELYGPAAWKTKVIASHTITEPLLTQDQFSALICMAFITTLIAPLSLKWIVKKACTYDENAQFCSLWEKSKKV